MNTSRYKNQRSKRSRDPLERRMDKLVESGRHFVDGVAGNRPGQRGKDNRNRINDMGRAIGEKMDWFFEDEDDWSNPLGSEMLYMEDDISTKKRPLTAISLRGPKAISAAPNRENFDSDISEEWPEQSTFKVDRWKRGYEQKSNFNETKNSSQTTKSSDIKLRPLPRSSRRRQA